MAKPSDIRLAPVGELPPGEDLPGLAYTPSAMNGFGRGGNV